MKHPGQILRDQLATNEVVEPFIGVYDSFSARIAAACSSNLFLSGFGFAAGHYGLPDIGYISWSDMVAAAWRIRQILPDHKLLVDIDDGYVDPHTACHVVSQLEQMGVAMVMLEDQARPRRCGHVDGKILLPLAEYMDKLTRVLDERDHLCVLARTDASGDEIFRRLEAMSKTGADVLLVDGIDSVETLVRVLDSTDKPVLFNQIAGGKSPRLSLEELRGLGVKLVQYSAPLLFAAQHAMEQAMDTLFERGGVLAYDRARGDVGVAECTALLQGNSRRKRVEPAGAAEAARTTVLAERA
jgi:2-methylisocitrate lyase-like PEP mutase family enzyme